MSFKDDIEEVKQLWGSATLPTKALIVISVFLSSSSLTSLADVVFGWKGFLLDSVMFYREYVSGPIRTLASRFGLIYSSELVDIIIVCAILVGTALRSYWTKSRDEEHIAEKVIKSAVWLTLLLLFIFVPLDKTSLQELYWVFLFALITTYIIEPYTPGMESSKTRKILWYMPLVLILSLLLLLGAINSGLSR